MTYRKAKACSRQDIRKVANFIRRIDGSENVLFFDIVRFLEIVFPSIVDGFSLEIGTKDEMGDAQGLTYPDKLVIKIREDVYDRAVKGVGRDRLTLAHELYHLLNHDESNITFARTDNEISLKTYEDPEWQADAFGGELLIPKHLIANMTAEEIADKCQVSLAAAKFCKRH